MRFMTTPEADLPTGAEARAWISMAFSTYRETVEPDPGPAFDDDSPEVNAYITRAMLWARSTWPELHARMSERIARDELTRTVDQFIEEAGA